jgi:1,2-diacylglycerol 3-alpha-glucosyltransferase
MRIGMMVDTYKPYVSGITNYIDLNKRALEQNGHEVYVFTFGDLDYQDDEPRVIRNPGLPLADTGYYLSLRYKTAHKKLLRTMDVVHVHHPFLSGRLALNYCRRPYPIPIVFTNHTRYDLYAQIHVPLLPKEISNGLLQAYMPDFCGAVNLVTSPSIGMKEVLRKYGVKGHIEVMPHGIDLSQFHHAQPLIRGDFGYTANDILLIYAGRIAPEKNLEFLIRSFAGVSQVIPNTHLLIVGGGQKQFEDEIKQLPYELGIVDRIRFVGMVPYNQLPSYLAMCNAFVTTSASETFGMSTVESMSAGLPAIAVHSPGASDIIEDGKNGFLCKEDIASFTARLTLSCLNKDLLKQMGTTARKFSRKYDISQTSKVMLGHYSQLMEITKPISQNFDERLKSILEEFLR